MFDKTIKYTLMSMAAVTLYSCHSSSSVPTKSTEFDIPAYFKKEIAALQQRKPAVFKSVTEKEITETKTLNDINWEKELAQFTAIDLNKNNFNGLTKKDSIDQEVTYIFGNKNKDSMQIKVSYTDDKPSSISINKKTHYILFSNDEYLYYEAGKKYVIYKSQHILGLGDKQYHIEGIIK